MNQKRQSEFALVAAMNVAFGNPMYPPSDFKLVPMAPSGNSPRNPEAWMRVERQLRNVNDEINELATAISVMGVDDLRDALCDIRVFALGGLHFLGANDHPESAYTISASAPIPAMLSTLDPLVALRAAYQFTMAAVRERSYLNTVQRTSLVIWATHMVGANFGLDAEQQQADMEAVIKGNMTRFVKDADDMAATMAVHAKKGVTETFVEGEFPTAILKSAKDQPDAPKGKFLKSASYEQTVFTELHPEVLALVEAGMARLA